MVGLIGDAPTPEHLYAGYLTCVASSSGYRMPWLASLGGPGPTSLFTTGGARRATVAPDPADVLNGDRSYGSAFRRDRRCDRGRIGPRACQSGDATRAMVTWRPS